jgi:phosphomannomutase
MVFAASGDEEDPSEDILPEASILAGAMAASFADYIGDTVQKSPTELTLVLALDSRPTGPALADAMLRVFLSRGIRIHYLFIASAPEAMAYARQNPDIDGFCYISASHNPIGHNGVKFGLSNGGVLGGDQAKNLINRFMLIRETPEFPVEIFQEIKNCPEQLLEKVLQESHKHKNLSLTYYRDFTNQVVADSDDAGITDLRIHNLRQSIQKNRMGILAELNGSARTLTIDRQYLEDLGVTVQVVNGIPRQITHRIVPEGRSLDLCKSELEKAFGKDPCFQLGYVPDNDGDRGNLVYLNSSTGKAKQIEAQEIFALTVMAELAWLVVSGQLTYDEHNRAHQRVAVAVNGPTSMRIEEVCRAFDVDVFRAEVGEANVVTLAHNLRKKGYLVRILGEGSNGGNITHPSSVRDPLNTICSLLKVLTMRGDSNAHTSDSSRESPAHMGLFQIYCKKIGQAYNPDFTIQDVLQSLPAYTTTSAYEDRAILQISTISHAELKQRYEKLFRRQWLKKAPMLKKKLGIETWRVINYEGIQERVGLGPEYRTGDQRGGFKIIFKDEKGLAVAFIWMRGSGTEPVFRVLADLRGENPELEDHLLQWHKSMIQEADKE